MLVFDAHLDLAWNALDWNRDLRLPVKEIRRRESAEPDMDFKALSPSRSARDASASSLPPAREALPAGAGHPALRRWTRPTPQPARADYYRTLGRST